LWKPTSVSFPPYSLLEAVPPEPAGVVDAAMEACGAALPVRATTAIDGDREWLAGRSDVVREALEDLAGHREYHVPVTWDDDAAEAAGHATDAELDSLRDAVAAASPGEACLGEKQYERALGKTVAEREAALAAVEDEDALGAALDGIADRKGVTVRFTGPWAPCSFAPDHGGAGP